MYPHRIGRTELASAYLKFLSYGTSAKLLTPISTISLKFKFSAYTTSSNKSKEKNHASKDKYKTKNCTFFNLLTRKKKKKKNSFYLNWTRYSLRRNKPSTQQQRVARKTIKIEPLRWYSRKEQNMVPYHVEPSMSFEFASFPNEKVWRYWGIGFQLEAPREKRKP